ncbi:nucleoside-diphosphate sugar epimerase/dehydratase [Planctomycetota bacterium]
MSIASSKVRSGEIRRRTRPNSAPHVPELGRAALIVTDMALVAVALAIGYVLRFELELGALERVGRAPIEAYAKLYVLLVLAIAFLAHLYDLYRIDGLHSTLEETYGILKAVTIATGLVLALTFFYRGFSYSRLTFAYFWAVCVLLLGGSHAIFRRWLVGRFRAGVDLKRSILIGEPSSYIVERLVEEPAFGLDVIGYVGPPADVQHEPDAPAKADKEDDSKRHPSESGRVGALVSSAKARRRSEPTAIRWLGRLKDLPDIVGAEEVDEAVIVDHGITHRQLLNAIDLCEGRGIAVRLVPPIYDLMVQPADFTYVQNIPLIRVDERRYRRWSFFW